MGAEVIKLEKPGTGDVIRTVGHRGARPFVRLRLAQRQQAQFRHRREEEGRPRHPPAPRRSRSDVFLENFAPGVAERMGLGAAELCARNPRLIYCSLSGYGQDGPYRDVKAYDLLIQGEAGIIATTGYPGRAGQSRRADHRSRSSMYAAVGILLALYQREKTGRGQVIDISMFESALSWLGYFPHHYWHSGEEPARVGMRHQYVTPYGPYLAGDGKYVSLAVASAADWEIFCRARDRAHGPAGRCALQDTEARRKNRAVARRAHRGDFSASARTTNGWRGSKRAACPTERSAASPRCWPILRSLRDKWSGRWSRRSGRSLSSAARCGFPTARRVSIPFRARRRQRTHPSRARLRRRGDRKSPPRQGHLNSFQYSRAPTTVRRPHRSLRQSATGRRSGDGGAPITPAAIWPDPVQRRG